MIRVNGISRTEVWHVLPLLVCCLSFFLGGCAPKEVERAAVEGQSVREKNESKWHFARKFHIYDYHIIIGVTNDDANLYVRLATTDTDVQKSIVQSGCTVWIDSGGGKEKQYGLLFPVRSESVEERPAPKSPLPGEDAKVLGISAELKVKQGYLFYDLQIPYEQLGGGSRTTIADVSQMISVGLQLSEINRMEKREMRERQEDSGGSDTGMRAGMSGGKGGGKRAGMGGGNRLGPPEQKNDSEQQSARALEEWFTFSLN